MEWFVLLESPKDRAFLARKVCETSLARGEVPVELIVSHAETFRPVIEAMGKYLQLANYSEESREKILGVLSEPARKAYADNHFHRLLEGENFEEAMAIAQQKAATGTVPDGYEQLAGKLARIHPEGVKAWAEALPEGPQQRTVAANLAHHWGKSSFEECRAWVESLKPWATRDAALEQLIGRARVVGETDTLAQLVQKMTDPKKRVTMAGGVLRAISEDNLPTSEVFLGQLKLPAEEMERLQIQLESLK